MLIKFNPKTESSISSSVNYPEECIEADIDHLLAMVSWCTIMMTFIDY